MNLVDGQMFRFDLDDEPGDAARVKLPHREIIDTLQEVHDMKQLSFVDVVLSALNRIDGRATRESSSCADALITAGKRARHGGWIKTVS